MRRTLPSAIHVPASHLSSRQPRPASLPRPAHFSLPTATTASQVVKNAPCDRVHSRQCATVITPICGSSLEGQESNRYHRWWVHVLVTSLVLIPSWSLLLVMHFLHVSRRYSGVGETGGGSHGYPTVRDPLHEYKNSRAPLLVHVVGRKKGPPFGNQHLSPCALF